MSERLLERRGEPSPGTGSGSLAGDGSAVQEAIRRLRMIALVLAIAPTSGGLLLAVVAPPGTPQHDARPEMFISLGVLFVTSVAVRRMLGSERLAPALRLDIGFAYQAVLAAVVAMFRHVTPWAPGDGFREISPVAVIIVVFAALVPNKPRRTLFASLVSAAMDPLALWISIARGNPAPSVAQMIAICGTPFVASGIATAVSRVVHGLARTADEARTMGSYRLIEKLGSGGMGEVWRAQHRLLARPAAVKLIRADAVGDPGALRRFEREAHATAALKEPNTIQLYDFGISGDGTFYYVMELLEGFDLEDLVAKHGPQPAERVVHLLRQVCASLEEAHARGLVHRDIKPANVYACRYGRHVDFVKVLDFGLVKPRDASAPVELAPTVTIDSRVAGTPAFIAPEMALGEERVDGRADIYAVGCLGYWLLTGQLVFAADSAMKMIVAHVHATPERPSSRTEIEVPAALDRLILECLEKDPSKRPRSAAELADRLAAIEIAAIWSAERARQWWDVHAPQQLRPSQAPLSGSPS